VLFDEVTGAGDDVAGFVQEALLEEALDDEPVGADPGGAAPEAGGCRRAERGIEGGLVGGDGGDGVGEGELELVEEVGVDELAGLVLEDAVQVQRREGGDRLGAGETAVPGVEVVVESIRPAAAVEDGGLGGDGPVAAVVGAGGVAELAPEAREAGDALGVGAVEEDIDDVEAVREEDERQVVAQEAVPDIQAANGEDSGAAGRVGKAQGDVEAGLVIEAGLVGVDDGDEAVAIWIAGAGEPAVETLDGGDGLFEEGAIGGAAVDGLDGLRQERGLDKAGVHRAAEGGAVEVEAVGVKGSRLPDDAVGNAAVALLGAQEGAQLFLCLLGVDVRPDDGVKAGVPEPLEGVGDGGGDAEGVGLAVDGRDAAAEVGPELAFGGLAELGVGHRGGL